MIQSMRLVAVILIGVALFAPVVAIADDGVDFFEKKIRPVLAAKCYSCHSAEAARKRSLKGGLQLDTRAGIRAGGESGPAIVPGDVENSLLIDSIRRKSFEMPPDESLPESVIADFVRWVELGAPDPRDGEPVEVSYEIDYVEGRKHWAYQPLHELKIPAVGNQAWPAGPVDQFILARIEQAKLEAAADAAPLAMIRRLTFDLTGLPPTLEQVRHFETLTSETAPAAYETLVAELLRSPHFGEQWARHWLDGIRYDPGLESSAFYRNWVIEAMNNDLPYNEFLRWQIAGDLLEHDDASQAASALTATQLIAYNGREDDFVESSLEVLGQQVFGISFNCGKCHDHKFDAFSQEDYYALAGILTSCEVPKSARDGIKLPGSETQIIALRDREAKRIGDARFLIGGDKSRPGEIVPRRLPQVFFEHAPPQVTSTAQSGRRELGDWIGAADNVLAARVMVNRVWQHLIGRGIVATTNDFGVNGQRPTHLELLDYLTGRLIEQNWSLKEVVREIVLSRTYRQAVEPHPPSLELDQANDLYTRAIPKRLQFEQVMDQSLAVAGVLELEVAEPQITINKWPQQRRSDKTYGGPRAIYCRHDDMLVKTFDGPDTELLTAERGRSVTAPQALHFLNSEMVRNLAEVTTQRIESLATAEDPAQFIETSYRVLFARPPNATEEQLGRDFIAVHGLKRYVHALFCTNEFLHLN